MVLMDITRLQMANFEKWMAKVYGNQENGMLR
jgi:hypothetical protein